MSGDDNQQDPNAEDGDLEHVMRAAEQAVNQVRGEAGSPDSPDSPDPGGDGQDVEAELAEAQAELAATRDKWLRAVADLDNYKKRVKRDIDDAIHRAVQNLLNSFLSVGDNLDRALSVAPPDTNDQLLKGIDMVRQEFFGALAKHGIKPIESVGKPFDPNIHDALQQMDSPDYAPGVVMMEYEKGYQRGEKLLRPARVIVAGPGSTGTPPADAGADAEAGSTSEAGEGDVN